MIARYTRQETLPATGPAIGAELMDGLGTVPAHGHDFIEIVLVEGGEAWHETRSGRRRVRRGYCAVLRPGEWHGWSHCDRLQVWNVYIGPEVLRRELSWLRATSQGSNLISPPLRGQVTERQLGDIALTRAIRWLTTMPPRERGDGIDTECLRVGAVSAALGEMAAAPSVNQAPVNPPANSRLAPTVAAALQLIEHDVSHPWTVAELAEHTHVSPSHLSRLFSQATGLAPITYLARLRAENVAADLIDGEDPVAEIGRRYGWPDPNYLSRRFHHFFGVSPRTFRRRYGRSGVQR